MSGHGLESILAEVRAMLPEAVLTAILFYIGIGISLRFAYRGKRQIDETLRKAKIDGNFSFEPPLSNPRVAKLYLYGMSAYLRFHIFYAKLWRVIITIGLIGIFVLAVIHSLIPAG